MRLTLRHPTLAIGCVLALAAAAPAEPISTLMEKAVYTEGTAGNLEEGIKLYQQIGKAADQLRGLEFEPLKILPAPWVDGEIMRLGLTSAAGGEIGTIVYTADAM